MSEDKLRLGGMALPNGVLVHGPRSWACAIRNDAGEIEVASAYKTFTANRVTRPFLRGPARLAEAMAVIPQVKRALPAAKLPMQNPKTIATMLAAAVATKQVSESERLRPVAREFLGGILSLAPAMLALRGSELAAYHGAEHISIGRYEHGDGAQKEHERCGGHLVGPLVATTVVGNVLAGLAPVQHRRNARAVAQIGAVAASTEIFGWMTRNPGNLLAQALSRPSYSCAQSLRIAIASSMPPRYA